ncbi:pheromone A receptor-domain-containing protein [Scleroderma yunnanense]
MDVNPTYPLFPIFAFFGFSLVLVPLPWHLQASNAGTCMYIAWTALACLFQFVNSVIWRNTALNVAPVWCDITAKFFIGASVGIPSAGLCISRRLYKIAVIKSVSVTREDKRRAMIVDLFITIGIPVVVMALHYVVQGHRFDILEDVGCWPAIYNALPAYFLVFMWPTLLGCVSFVYSALTLRAFYKRRLEFSHLVASNNSMNASCYVRLMLLACIEMASTIPISIVSLYISNKGVPLQPWISWADTHYNFSFVGLVPAVTWMSDPNYKASIEMTRWLFPACALLFFSLFGFASESRKHYCAGILFVAAFFGYKPSKGIQHSGPMWKCNLDKSTYQVSVGSLPVYVTPIPPCTKREDSFVFSLKDGAERDIEKAISCSSPTLPRYSVDESNLSPTITHHSEFTSNLSVGDAEVASSCSRPQSVEVPDEPTHSRPFMSPSIFPIGSISQSLNGGISVTIKTEYGIAL